MKSALPVIHSLGNAVERVLRAFRPTRRLVIVGYQAEQVKAAMQSIPELEFVEQTEQLGTGHAVQHSPLTGLQGDLLVLNGDVPLRPETLKQLLGLTRASKLRHNHSTAAQFKDMVGYFVTAKT